MINLLSYHVVNGSKSNKTDLQLRLKDKKELEQKRLELEQKHKCVVKTPLGDTVRNSYIFFLYSSDD
jgi:hypothetical protein